MPKSKSSTRTKAVSITKEVKERVWQRQNGRSLFAPYLPITIEECCCHYLSRSAGGLGIEENIFGCVQRSYRNEHMMYDGQIKPLTNLTRDEMKQVVRNHLIFNYPNWKEEDLLYRNVKWKFGKN